MYFEYFFIENLVINYIIINCTSILTKKYNSIINKVLGAVFGAVYSSIYLFSLFNLIFTLPFKILIIIFIIYISFKHKSKKDFISTSLVFFLVNIFISGTSYFVIYFTGMSHFKISFVIVCAYLSCELLKHIYKDIKMLKYLKSLTKEIQIKVLDKQINCTALVDSGNMLKDPINKNDVVIVDANKFADIIPNDVFSLNCENVNLENIDNVLKGLDKKISKKVRLIPYKHAASKCLEYVIGFKVDYIQIDECKIGEVVIGFVNLNEPDYEAIINPSLLNII